MDQFLPESVLHGAGQDVMGLPDALGTQAPRELGFQGLNLGGADIGERDMPDVWIDIPVYDVPVPFLGALPTIGGDHFIHPAVEPIAEQRLVGNWGNASIDIAQQLPQPALGLGLGPADGEELALPFAQGVTPGVYGQFPGAGAALSEGAFHSRSFKVVRRPSMARLRSSSLLSTCSYAPL